MIYNMTYFEKKIFLVYAGGSHYGFWPQTPISSKGKSGEFFVDVQNIMWVNNNQKVNC